MVLAAELLSMAPDTYCPTYRRWRKLPKHIIRKTGRTRELIVDSMTPGYMFVNVETSHQLADVYAHRDVYGFVSTSLGVCFARDSDIKRLRELEMELASGSSAQSKRSAKQIRKELQEKIQNLSMADLEGKTVKMKDGPLVGRVGVVVGAQSSGNEVKIDMQGLEVTTKVDRIELV